MDVDGKTIMQAPDGRLYQVDPGEVDLAARDQGWKVAPDEVAQARVAAREQYGKYGSTGQQALGLAETATRNATLGAVEGFGNEEDVRGRANVVAEHSPILNAVSGAVPSVAVGAGAAVLTGGTSIPAMIALEGAAGAYGGVGTQADEAFKRDEELTAEMVASGIGWGGLLGAAGGGAGALVGKGVAKAGGALRNRLVETAGKVTRKVETAAAEAAGIVKPGRAVLSAVDDPVKAASMRQAADAARPGFATEAKAALDDLDKAATHVVENQPLASAAVGDATQQAPELRSIVQGLEDEMPPGSPLREVTGSWKDRLSNTTDFRGTAGKLEQELQTLVAESRDPDLVKLLVKRQKDLQDYQASGRLFGNEAAEEAAQRSARVLEIRESRARLGALLEQHPYEGVVGTRAGKEIEDAAAQYASAIRSAAKDVPAPAPKAVTEAPEGYQPPQRKAFAATQTEAASRVLAEIRAKLGPEVLQAADDRAMTKLAQRKGLTTRSSVKQIERIGKMTPEQRAKFQGDMEQEAAISRRTPFKERVASDYHDRWGGAPGEAVPEGAGPAPVIDPRRLVGEAEARWGKLSGSPVAQGNQVDAFMAAKPQAPAAPVEAPPVAAPGAPVQTAQPPAAAPSMGRELMGEGAEMLAETVIPMFGVGRKLWKYRKQIMQLSGFARGEAGQAAAKLLDSEAVKSAGRAISSAGRAGAAGSAVAAGRYFSGLSDDDEKNYAQVRDTVQTLTREPDRLMDMLGEQMGDLPTEAPELHMAVAAKAHRAVQFLQAKLPPSFAYTLANPDGPTPSRTDMLELSLYWKGVTDAEGTMKSIGDGSAMPEQVEAFKAVYPSWFDEFSEELVDKLQANAREGKPLGGMRIAALDSLLGLGAQIDPTFGSDIAEIAHIDAKMKREERGTTTQYSPAPKAGERTKNKTLESVGQ